jgi:hypothetical protein
VTHAPGPCLRRTGSRTSAQNQNVHRETLGGGNDFPFRASLRDQVRDFGVGQSRREPLVPRFQKRGGRQVVCLCQTVLDRIAGMRRPGPAAER